MKLKAILHLIALHLGISSVLGRARYQPYNVTNRSRDQPYSVGSQARYQPYNAGNRAAIDYVGYGAKDQSYNVRNRTRDQPYNVRNRATDQPYTAAGVNTFFDRDNTVLSHEIGKVELNTECQPSITGVACGSVCKGDLIFEDNFDTLDLAKWQREVSIGMASDDREFVSYQNRPENCFVNNGELHIMTNLLSEVPGFHENSITSGKLDLRANCTAFLNRECYREARPQQYTYIPPIVSARIRTKGSFEFRYGRVEVRAKLPKGDWIYPQILLDPAEHWYGYDKYASGQMRVAFARGNNDMFCNGRAMGGNYLQGGAVLSTRYVPQYRELWLRENQHLADIFHIYALEWTDRYIALEIDGTEYGRIHGRFEADPYYVPHSLRWINGEFMAPFDRKFFITLGVGVGGNTDFPDNCQGSRTNKPWTNHGIHAARDFWNARNEWLSTWNENDAGLLVDYVRVYAI